MTSRHKLAKRFVRDYTAVKVGKGRLLNLVVSAMGWNRDQVCRVVRVATTRTGAAWNGLGGNYAGQPKQPHRPLRGPDVHARGSRHDVYNLVVRTPRNVITILRPLDAAYPGAP